MSDDTRVICLDCNNQQRGFCTQPKRALLASAYGKAEIGPTLAALPQHCPAFTPTARRRAAEVLA